MVIGYFLLVGDKTTCGGQIITGDHTMTFNRRATAREGDKVTCGKHPGTYMIIACAINSLTFCQTLTRVLDPPCIGGICNKKAQVMNLSFLSNLAVREGFEPSIRFHVYTLSRRAPSASRTPHHVFSFQ